MYSRRHLFIRTVAAFAGDFAVGFAMASACIWVIQAAALGLFLSFLLWLLAAIAALSLSQYVVHPVVSFALSDHKVDQAIDMGARLVRSASELGRELGSPSWRQLRQGFGRFASSMAPK